MIPSNYKKPQNYKNLYWRQIDENDPKTYPTDDNYILLNFINFSLPAIGRCEGNEEDGFTFYEGDDDKPCVEYGLFVNAWMPLPRRLEDI